MSLGVFFRGLPKKRCRIGIFESMNLTPDTLQNENADILRRYRGLLRAASKQISDPTDKKKI